MPEFLRKLALVAALGLVTAACAQPARTSAMIADVSQNAVLVDGSPLKNSVELSVVTGGKKTDPMWISEVSNEDFSSALRLSLKQHTMLSEANGPLVLTTTLISLEQPIMGFDMTVTSTVRYQVAHATNGSVFDGTIKTPYPANFSDAALGAERLRLANEGTIRTNIKPFIDALITASKKDPGKFGGDVRLRTS